LHEKQEFVAVSVPVAGRCGPSVLPWGLFPSPAASTAIVVGIAPLPAQAQPACPVSSWLPIVLLLGLLVGLVWHYRRGLSRSTLATARLARETAWQQSLLDSAAHGIVATDTTGTIVSFNRAAQRMLGYRPEEVLGKVTPAVLHDPEELIQRAVDLTQALGETVTPGLDVLVPQARRGRPEERDWTWIRKDGSRLPVRLSVTPVRDDTGVITGYMAIAVDLSARSDTERALQSQKALLQTTIDAMPGLYFQFDAEGHMLAWNRKYAVTLGLTDDEIRQMHALDVVHPEDVACALDRIRCVLDDGRTESAEIRVLARNGCVIPVLVTGARVMSEGGPTLVGTAVDLSSRVAAEAALARSRQEVERRNESLQLLNALSRRLHGHLEVDAICEQAIEAFMRLENTHHIAFYQLSADGERLLLTHSHGFNEALRETFRVLPVAGTLAGLALAEQRLMHASDLSLDERTTSEMRQRLAEHHMHAAIIIPLIYSGQPLGTIHLVFQHRREFGELELETLETLGKTLSLALANARHVDRLQHLAHHDTLTGLPNRAILHREFERSLAAEGGRARRMTLLLLDLDRFKEINDTLGHYVGDQLLKQVGPRLQPLLAPRSGLLCRLGGDEFAVLLPESLATGEGEEDYARSLVTALREPFMVNDMQLGVDASVGIALYPLDGEDSHTLMRAADVAMYAAKRTGRGVARYESALDRHSPERLAMMADLERAIREGQLLLHYQPKYDLKRGRITGFEALVRWLHPRLGLLLPEHFLHLAEMGGAIHALTERVLDLALADLRHWQDAGRDYGVAVNLSAQSLLDERFLVLLQDLLRKHAVRPERLELEITETALMHDPARASALLRSIAALGVKLSIDDYGTGYSSLGYLHRLPIHALKIDRMFVRDMPVNEHDSIIVRSTVAMAHNLGLEVLAEGVEDGRTEDLLRDMGCDHIQGYHLSRPLPVEELTTWLATAR
jgi:diguanylate cyclase (GGDEF)-like protein/PAS domain S-box-containing protein